MTLTTAYRISRAGWASPELAYDLSSARPRLGRWTRSASVPRVWPPRAAAVQDRVLDQAAADVDEAGCRTTGEGRALWTATIPGTASVTIAEVLHREQFAALIGTMSPFRSRCPIAGTAPAISIPPAASISAKSSTRITAATRSPR